MESYDGESDGTEAVTCLCKAMIPINQVFEHTKKCTHFRIDFGNLSQVIEKAINNTKDDIKFGLLCALFSNSESICKSLIKKPAKPSIPFSNPTIPKYPKMYFVLNS